MTIADKLMITVDMGTLAEMRYEVRICIKYVLRKYGKILRLYIILYTILRLLTNYDY